MSHGWQASRRSLLAAGGALAAAAATGPLRAAPARPASRRLRTADGRAVAVTEWRPQGRPLGTILFSHGAGSAPWHYDPLIAPWVAAGWRVIAPLHVDSREHPDTAKFPGLASWKARIEDMRLLVAELAGRAFVAAGHSYGGLVALTLGGARPVVPQGLARPLVPRLARAVIAFSPPAPIPVLVTAEGYGALEVPALVQTGTLDVMPGMAADGWRGHLAPYEAAAPGGARYGLVIEGANHYFGGTICDMSQPGPPQWAQLDLAARYAGLFLAGFGADDAAARTALDARLTEAMPAALRRR